MLLATVGVAFSTFVGAAVGDVLWLFALTTAVWGLAAGMLVSLGVAAGIIGVQSVIGLLIITQYSMPLEDGLGRAGLVLLGGLVQVVLLLTAWPLRRSPVERSALAQVYRSLAAYAAALPAGAAEPPTSGPSPRRAGRCGTRSRSCATSTPCCSSSCTTRPSACGRRWRRSRRCAAASSGGAARSGRWCCSTSWQQRPPPCCCTRARCC